MAIFHSNIKIRITQIVSIVAFCALIPNKYFPDSDYTKTISPFNWYIIVIFFIAQGFMIYYFIQENKAKRIKNKFKLRHY